MTYNLGSYFMSFSLMLAGLVLFSSCGCAMGELYNGKNNASTGWIDNDTFQATATGVPAGYITDITERKDAAKRNAVLNAQNKIIKIFKRSRMRSRSGFENFDLSGEDIPRELIAIVDNGHVHDETWDDNQNCEIIYMVHAKNLKNKMQAADW